MSPSGRLTDTWGMSYADYPTNRDEKSPDFGFGAENPVYHEDIFVGYRYFETFRPQGVRYPFGFGLSYTTFQWTLCQNGFSAMEDRITVRIRVKNAGNYPGKEVLQLYCRAPQGMLGKPRMVLMAFAKTDLLMPEEEEDISMVFNPADMASYDEQGITGTADCFVLEPGRYEIYCGTDVRDAGNHPVGVYTEESLRVTEKLSAALSPEESFPVLRPGGTDGEIYREDWDSCMADISAFAEETEAADDNCSICPGNGDKGIYLDAVYTGQYSIDEFLSQFTMGQLIQIFSGSNSNRHNLFPKSYGSAGVYGQTFTDYGALPVTLADGPSGLRLVSGRRNRDGSLCESPTAFPVPVMAASTWNVSLLQNLGRAVGQEAQEMDVDVWLAPGMNIHRDPTCGRTFEYYSEDPVLTGRLAAAIVCGLQEKGIGACPKHLACNNQEFNCQQGSSIVSRRALREIYLKAFEIVVKTADPWYMMSSYNKINGRYSLSNGQLIRTVLRREWGFSRVVMSDWAAGADGGNSGMLRAAHELRMPNFAGRFFEIPEEIHLEDGAYVCSCCGRRLVTMAELSLGWVPDFYTSCGEILNDTSIQCNRPIPSGPWRSEKDLPAGCSVRDGMIVNAQGQALCLLDEWAEDRSGVLTGLVEGKVTLQEIFCCARRTADSLMHTYHFKKIHSRFK